MPPITKDHPRISRCNLRSGIFGLFIFFIILSLDQECIQNFKSKPISRYAAMFSFIRLSYLSVIASLQRSSYPQCEKTLRQKIKSLEAIINNNIRG